MKQKIVSISSTDKVSYHWIWENIGSSMKWRKQYEWYGNCLGVNLKTYNIYGGILSH